MITATRLRKGGTNSARGAARLIGDALSVTRRLGGDPKAGALVIVRADSAYYGYDVIAAARRAGARFSVTARMTPAVKTAITGIAEDAWTPIHYPNAIWDQDEQRLISNAEVAEVGFTAFTGRRQREHVSARLIVRRVKRLNPKTVVTVGNSIGSEGITCEQDELFAAYRHHAVFTDSPYSMLDAETCHRRHAIIEQVIGDAKNGPLTHLPPGSFAANSAWLVLAAMAFNLTRATGALASAFHARVTTATIRAQLITVPARLARTAGHLTLHLPTNWPWEHVWDQMFTVSTRPPPTRP